LRSTLEQALDYFEHGWGSDGSLRRFAPSRTNDQAFKRRWGRLERLSNSPAGAAGYAHVNRLIDISDIVTTIRVPTLVIHRTNDTNISVEGGRNAGPDFHCLNGAKH
jgi:hypothetical protein